MRTEESWNHWEDKKLKTYFPPRIVKELKEYNYIPIKESKIESLFIYGNVETGKTLYVASLLVSQVKYDFLNSKETNAVFVSFPDMLADIKSSYYFKDKNEITVLEKYLKSEILVIDDFLTNRPTDWVIDILYFIINTRYENMLITCITSNNSLEELEELLQDQRITRRINRMCKIIEKQNF